MSIYVYLYIWDGMLVGRGVPQIRDTSSVVESWWQDCKEMTCRIRLSILLRCHLLILFVSVVSGGIFTAERPPFIEEFSEDYGVDVTAPIHHYLDDRSYFGKRYDKMIGG